MSDMVLHEVRQLPPIIAASPKTARTGTQGQQEVIYTERMTYVKNSLFKFKIYEARRDAALDLRKSSNSMVN